MIAVSVAAPTFPASADVHAIIRLALSEDVGRGDLTTEATVSPDAIASAEVLQKSPGRRLRPARARARFFRRRSQGAGHARG